MDKTILITGENGFIGSRLFTLLGDSVIPSHFSLFDRDSIKMRLNETKPKVIIHLAGISSVSECEKNPELAVKTNELGTQNLIEVLVDLSLKPHFIFFSTAHVYDFSKLDSSPILENALINPMNRYAETKRNAELILEKYANNLQIPVTILRVFNYVHHSQKHPTFLTSLYWELLKQKEQKVVNPIMVGNLQLYRDMGAFRDLLNAVVAVINLKNISNFHVMNVCGGIPRKLENLAKLLMIKMDIKRELLIDPSRFRENDPESIVGSHEKLTRLTGWSPQVKTDEELITSFLSQI